MKKKIKPKPNPEEEASEVSETPAPLGSMFPTVPVTPQRGETNPKKVVENIPEATLDNEDKTESTLKDAILTETSATDLNLEKPETEELTSSENSEDGEAEEVDIYGGPWGIIKHTGYLNVAVWAVLTAVITGATAFFLTPGDFTWIALGVLGFMTGVVAAVDRKTHLIKNQHTIATAILTVPLALLVAFNLGTWNVLFGVIAAVAVFGVFIFLILKVGFGSGGDIKFSPVPAFALGVVNPLISALWLFYALIITVILLIVRKQKSTSFGEGMAISLPFAIASVYALYAMTGLPYMEPVTQ